ncbi:hypothetical protein EV421DRAFT_1787872 [Armillaria borealis]|uniref:Uncharacterized protein n=1 Tax=Armillaria borealis TaxID=47425 RepID=A0AA39JUL5_9AGAR|nr:hypothetical protein EV421DRAFT_1787872 [Armillaria borealis]
MSRTMSDRAKGWLGFRRQTLTSDTVNRASGGHSPDSPFSTVPLQASSVQSFVEDNSQPHSNPARAEIDERRRKPLSAVADEMVKQMQDSSANWELSRILPPRPSADRDPSELQLTEAWRKLQEYSQLNILSPTAEAAATAEVGGLGVIVAMLALLRVVVNKVEQHIGEDAGYSRVLVKANNLLDSFDKIVHVVETRIVGQCQFVLDDLAEAIVCVIDEVATPSEMHSNTRMLTLCVLLQLKTLRAGTGVD